MPESRVYKQKGRIKEESIVKAIIFGCGGVGIQTKKKLEAEGMEIIAFSDNNEQKWNSTFESCRVISPNEITSLQYDVVAIGIYKAASIVKEQLLTLGIPEKKITIVIEPIRIFPSPLPYESEELEKLELSEYSSANTKAYMAKKIKISDEEFLDKLDDLKRVLKANNIPRKKVCIVSGAVQQAYGLRRSKKFDDIDIIMTSDLRKIYGTGLVIVSTTAEMHPQNEYKIPDDEIIENEKYHFVFNDFKFACLEVMKE